MARHPAVGATVTTNEEKAASGRPFSLSRVPSGDASGAPSRLDSYFKSSTSRAMMRCPFSPVVVPPSEARTSTEVFAPAPLSTMR